MGRGHPADSPGTMMPDVVFDGESAPEEAP